MGMEDWYAAGRRARVSGLEVFYRRSGSGEALVCLHGFPTSSWDFELVWPSLSRRFDAVAHDLIGLGRSEKPERPLTVDLQATVVEDLARGLGIERAHLLAHDLGDTVAQELLARQVEGRAAVRWLSCVFLNGGLFPEAYRPRLIQKLLVSPLGPWIAKLTSERTFRRNMARIFSPAHPPDEGFLAGSWQLLVEGRGRAMLPRLLRYMDERRVHRERWVGALQQAVVAMRLIDGVLDPVSGRKIAERYTALVPGADVVLLDDVGHYPHVEAPEVVLEHFHDFHDCLSEGR